MPVPDRPQVGEYAEYFQSYVSLVDDVNIVEAMAAQATEVQSVLRGLGGVRTGSFAWALHLDVEAGFGALHRYRTSTWLSSQLHCR